jgi:hypothetical protein
MCEAEEILQRTLFELGMQETAGVWNPGKIRGMLAREHEDCDQANRMAS